MSLSSKTIDIVKATAPVLAEHGATITTVFYKEMFKNHPELLNIFNKTNQVKGEQQQALANMVYAAAKNIDQLETLLDEVKLVAHKHRGLNVKPEHYPIVGEHLLFAIKDVLKDAATDDIMEAWAEAYGVIAQVFIDVEAEMYKEAEEQPGGWDGFKDFLVVDKVKESDVITSFYLKAKDGKELANYEAGQYLSIRVLVPGETHKQIRHYTLSQKPGQDTYRISVKKEADFTPNGLVSTYLHDSVNIDDTIEASAPAGSFTLENDNKPVVFISGGVGITPMLSMFETLAEEKSDRDITFLHAAQNESVHAFNEHVKDLTASLPNASYVYGYSDAENKSGEQNFNGFVTKEIIENVIKEDAVYYIVGPIGFMEHIAQLLAELNVASEQVRYELFGPKKDITQKMTTVIA